MDLHTSGWEFSSSGHWSAASMQSWVTKAALFRLPFYLIISGTTQWKQCIFSYEIPAKSPGLRQEGNLGKGSRTKLWYVSSMYRTRRVNAQHHAEITLHNICAVSTRRRLAGRKTDLPCLVQKCHFQNCQLQTISERGVSKFTQRNTGKRMKGVKSVGMSPLNEHREEHH